MKKYVREKVCPYGLRVQLFPNFKIDSDDFRTKWETALTNCSINLLQLLIDHYQQELALVDQDVQALLLTGTYLSNTVEFATREIELNNHLEKRKIYHHLKKKKLFCDRNAISAKKAYRWVNHAVHTGGRPFRHNASNTVPNGGDFVNVHTSDSLPFLIYRPFILRNAEISERPADCHPQMV